MHSSRMEETRDGSVVKALDHYGEQFLSLFDSSDSDDVGNRDDETQDAVETRGLEDTSVHNDEKKMGVSMNVKDQQKTRKHGKEMHDVDAIFTTNKSAPSGGGGGGDSTSTGKRKSKIGNSSRGNKTKEAPAKGCEEHEEEERRRRRMEKRRFMASKPDRILSDEPTVNHRNSRRIERKEKQSDREEFKAMAREIQSFGATGLDKKARARFEQNILMGLGAKKQKGVQISARIGHGMKKKSAQREHRALEEAIASGMVSRKALASKKRRDMKKQGVDRGLNEDMGSFRNGVLRVVSKKRSR